MSDPFFDAARATGNYPPKGWGWQSESYQRAEVSRQLAAREPEPWVLAEANRLGIAVAAS